MYKLFPIFLCFILLCCTQKNRNENNLSDINYETYIPNEIIVETENLDVNLENEDIGTEVLVAEWIFDENDRWFIGYINETFFGTYLPIQFINSIETSKNYTEAMKLNKDRYSLSETKNFYHDILIVTKDRIWSNLGFNDGYAIPAIEVKDFDFLAYNQNISIIDNNGFLYIRISNEIELNFSLLIRNFIGNIVFDDLIKNDIVIVENGFIFFKELNYELFIRLDWETENIFLELMDMDNREYVVLRIENEVYNFYKAERNRNFHFFVLEVLDEILFSIEL